MHGLAINDLELQHADLWKWYGLFHLDSPKVINWLGYAQRNLNTECYLSYLNCFENCTLAFFVISQSQNRTNIGNMCISRVIFN